MPTDHRLDQIVQWVSQRLELETVSIAPASADASFRRYFRVTHNQKSWIVMDAPPSHEDCKPFIHVATMLESVGVHAPHIFDFNESEGFMLLSDLGSTSYLQVLTIETADRLYQQAIDSLISMQTLQNQIPDYDEQLLTTEMNLFRDWYLDRHLGIQLNDHQHRLFDQVCERLIANALQQPQVFVHRDFHSRNLMLTPTDNPGVIDFQDAVRGPLTYDLVSLLKDCYIAWSRDKVLAWIDYYRQQAPDITVDNDTFIRWFDLMGVQRQLKAIGIFARLNHRDNKPAYLADIPRTFAYIYDSCQLYPQLSPLQTLLDDLGLKVDKQLQAKLQ